MKSSFFYFGYIFILLTGNLVALEEGIKEFRSDSLNKEKIGQIYNEYKAAAQTLNSNWRPTQKNEKTPEYKVSIDGASGISEITLSGSIILILEASSLNVRVFGGLEEEGFINKADVKKLVFMDLRCRKLLILPILYWKNLRLNYHQMRFWRNAELVKVETENGPLLGRGILVDLRRIMTLILIGGIK